MTKMKWDRAACSEEALKFSSRAEFLRGCKSAYESARKHGWLNEICSHMKSFEEVYRDKVKFEDSLEFKNPKIAAEWNYEKNEGITPSMVAPTTRHKYWWICPTCHQTYESPVCSRFVSKKKDEKCPVCRGRIIIKGYNSLKAKFPEIVEKEWDYALNVVDPDTLPPHSNKEYWWKCLNGHESYRARIGSKTFGDGYNCPRCSHQKLSEETSLQVVAPDIAKEWHPTKNNRVTPKDVFSHANKKAWWLCSVCGYEWESEINGRVSGRGCPRCNHSLHRSFPQMAVYYYVKQLFPDAISEFKYNSNSEIDIYIPSLRIGFEYDGAKYHSEYQRERDLRKDKTLNERGIRLIRFREIGSSDLGPTSSEIYYILPSDDHISLQHKLNSVLSSIAKSEGIKYDIVIDIKKDWNIIQAKKKDLSYYDSLAGYIDQLSKEGKSLKALWDYEENYPLTPEMVKPSARRKVSWVCPTDSSHRWKAYIYSIKAGCGCPKCSRKYRYSKEEWLAKARLTHGEKYDYSLVEYSNTMNKVTIICPIHGKFEQRPDTHASGCGCPYCAGNTISLHPKESLSTIYPELVDCWDYEGNKKEFDKTPDTVRSNDSKKYLWKCTNGKPHSFYANIRSRHNGMNCAVCHGKQVSYDTSLAHIYPHLLKYWSAQNKKNPEEVNVGGDIKYLWECDKHGTYKSIVRSMAEGRCCCPECCKNKLTPEAYKKRIKEKYPNIVLITDYVKMTQKIRFRCTLCGEEKDIRPQDLDNRGCRCNRKKKRF